jgi:riboflavin synthase
MFTGIIEDLGTVKRLDKTAEGASLVVESRACASEAKIGDSVSVNGSCLTVIDAKNDIMRFDISSETLKKSNLGELKAGERVNIESSLKAGSRLGGHFVTGHIDTTGRIISKEPEGGFVKIEIELPKPFMPYLAEKGSVAVDGISLTVNSLKEASFTMMLIPHTLSMTTLGQKKRASTVNIETDILAKYVQKLINRPSRSSDISSNITSNFLQEHGFI